MRTEKKDIEWYVKSIFEAFMIFLMCACLIGFIVSLFLYGWNKEIANIVMGWSVCVGIVNFLFLASWDGGWREDYGSDYGYVEHAEKYDHLKD